MKLCLKKIKKENFKKPSSRTGDQHSERKKKSQTLDIVTFALFNIVLNERGLYRYPIVYDLIDVECPEYTDIEEVN